MKILNVESTVNIHAINKSHIFFTQFSTFLDQLEGQSLSQSGKDLLKKEYVGRAYHKRSEKVSFAF